MSKQSPSIDPQEPVIVENALELELVSEAIDWQHGDVLTLPEGVRAKVLNENEAEGRTDLLVKFPPGYVEPSHTHEGAHASLLLQGRMRIHGHDLTPGDYVYGHQVEHGPMEYPDGAIMFASFVGGSPGHRDWDEE
jgi:quercetin dioxygenase-like cupin family protein